MTDLPPAPARLAAIDRLRGFVMVVMASDHASHVFYAHGVMRDSAFMRGWNQSLPTVPFLFRWLSHLCAPTFVFLAGASIALAASRRTGAALRAYDRDLALRGLLLIALEMLFITPVWGLRFEMGALCQVLWALGVGMLAMVALRRLPAKVTLALGVALAFAIELPFLGAGAEPQPPGVLVALLVTGGFGAGYAVVYPALPWLAPMLLGHAFGVWLARGGSPLRATLGGAAAALAIWCLVKFGDGYGNLRLCGVHDSWLRWLQCSKYPPSLAFLALELGLSLALLAGLFWWEGRRRAAPSPAGLLLTLGQTALFFYVGHIALLEGAGALLRVWLGADAVPGSLPRTLLATALAVLVLWPAGLWFRSLRRRHPSSLLRLI